MRRLIPGYAYSLWHFTYTVFWIEPYVHDESLAHRITGCETYDEAKRIAMAHAYGRTYNANV